MLERKIQAWFPFQVGKYFKGTTLLRRQRPSETEFQIPKVKVAWGVLNSQPFAIANALRSQGLKSEHVVQYLRGWSKSLLWILGLASVVNFAISESGHRSPACVSASTAQRCEGKQLSVSSEYFCCSLSMALKET